MGSCCSKDNEIGTDSVLSPRSHPNKPTTSDAAHSHTHSHSQSPQKTAYGASCPTNSIFEVLSLAGFTGEDDGVVPLAADDGKGGAAGGANGTADGAAGGGGVLVSPHGVRSSKSTGVLRASNGAQARATVLRQSAGVQAGSGWKSSQACIGVGTDGGYGPDGTINGNDILVDEAAGRGNAPGGGPGDKGKGGKGEAIDALKNESNVKVAVLVRPMLDFELAKGGENIVSLRSQQQIRLPRKPQVAYAGGAAPNPSDPGYVFEYDRVYKVDSAAQGKKAFHELVVPVVERFCQGFNGTVLSYGQTGSGKTYTMGTSKTMSDLVSPDPQGIIPRTLALLFQYIKLASEKYDVSLKLQFIEIYQDYVQDLLREPNKPVVALDLREKPDGEVFVENASELLVGTKDDCARALELGNANRVTAAHKMNSESSRSHAIVTLVLEQRVKLALAREVPKDLHYLRSKLHLVDLAGSERVRDTGATGDRFAEGVAINKGLLELGNVINALTEGKTRKHVPYRNSKLTRVLQDSLGGNSETLFLACISPSNSNHEHTLNTLRYASRARAIKNMVRLNNQISLEEEVEYLRALVLQLQGENTQLKQQLAIDGGQGGSHADWASARSSS